MRGQSWIDGTRIHTCVKERLCRGLQAHLCAGAACGFVSSIRKSKSTIVCRSVAERAGAGTSRIGLRVAVEMDDRGVLSEWWEVQ